MLVAPESTMPMAFVGNEHCWRVWLALTLIIFGKVKAAMSRVGLKLSVRVKSLSISDLLISALLTVSHRHNHISQLGGRLYLFLANSKHASGS